MLMLNIARIAHHVPQLPYEKMAAAILGTTYTLTLAFIGERRARALNLAHRGKSYVPNVLSFPLDESVGEIYICPRVAEKEAKKFGMSPTGYIGYLFIHGCLHLKGYDHGATMERTEQKYVRRFALK
jgi:probable rRNA maturation factor